MVTSLPKSLRWLLAASLLTAGLGVSEASAQNRRPRSASLARVLASIADDYRTGQAVWFLLRARFPENVVGVYNSESDVIAAARGAAEPVVWYGPYVTPADPMPWDVVSVLVVVRRGATTDTVRYTPAQMDALFLTRAAAQRFLVPYYTNLYGQDFGDRLFATFDTIGGGGGGGGGGHCTSRACFVDPNAPGGYRILEGFERAR